MLLKIIKWFLAFFRKAEKESTIKYVPVDEPLPIVDEPKPKKLKWDTKEDARHSVRVMCDNAGLSVREKNIICAVIQAESNFDINAINKNIQGGKVMSTDWGICQINDYYHIGTGKFFTSVDEVLTVPEKSVSFIIQQYKLGNLTWWIAYRNGSYKKYL